METILIQMFLLCNIFKIVPLKKIELLYEYFLNTLHMLIKFSCKDRLQQTEHTFPQKCKV